MFTLSGLVILGCPAGMQLSCAAFRPAGDPYGNHDTQKSNPVNKLIDQSIEQPPECARFPPLPKAPPP
ncbi:hypothetical protein EBL89_19355 [Cereibacter sphaeroides]|nr:hypothetical protein DQL45_18710 [Cereibacter sphaeroides 2.4.1]AZB57439.1 hypothetical protein EBL89_19355 [Cereibacter sphaeroides]AZB61714.1 hypothetical protein EBL88_19440 [Cereibacter sphaeroides]